MGRSRSRERTRRIRSPKRRSADRRSRSREKRRADKEKDREQRAQHDEQRETEEIAMRIEAEVQRRVQDRTSTAEFEAAVQAKLDAEIEMHLSVMKVLLEKKKKKLIDEFQEKTMTEEKSKQELEAILRTNQRKIQEHQQKAGQADQSEALLLEQQRRKKMQENMFKVMPPLLLSPTLPLHWAPSASSSKDSIPLPQSIESGKASCLPRYMPPKKQARGASRGGRASARKDRSRSPVINGRGEGSVEDMVPTQENGESHGQLPTIMRSSEINRLLQDPNSSLGAGTSAVVLFHEATYDSAMIALDTNGAEMTETNDGPLDILYVVDQAEDQQVVFEIEAAGVRDRLSTGCEVSVPHGARYSLRNESRTLPARLLAVVPREAA